jgi:hypothetical protein
MNGFTVPIPAWHTIETSDKTKKEVVAILDEFSPFFCCLSTCPSVTIMVAVTVSILLKSKGDDQ